MAELHEPVASEVYDTEDATSASGSYWSSLLDDEAFSTTPLGWLKSNLFTAIGSSVITTQFNLDLHDILPKLAWRFPMVVKASWDYVNLTRSQPRTCSLCQKKFFWMDGPLRDARCWQCNRVFHDKCLWQAGIKPPPQKSRLSRPWFHSAGCFKVDFLLRQSIVESPLKFKDGLSLSYVLRGMNPTPQQMRKNLDAWSFFSNNFTDFPGHPSDPLLYVLLNKGRKPVSGAVLELFGQDLAHIKFAATHQALRGQGLYSQLQELLELWLDQLGVAQVAVSVFPGTQSLWTHLGFRGEAAAQLQQLEEWNKEFGCDIRMGAEEVLVKKLAAASGLQERPEALEAKPEDASGVPIGTFCAGQVVGNSRAHSPL